MDSPPLILYRIGNRLHRMGLQKVALCISWLNRFLFSTWIPSSAEIGKRVKIGYWGLGIVIHSKAQIGDGCVIAQNVTIGRKEGSEGIPKLEEHVYVGSGACILGNLSIGRDSIIGANSVVTHSVPSRAVAVGSPAKIIRIMSESEIEEYRLRRGS
jgi:serine O-acetyltransferase